ncbi:PLP-dependent aminotransferase family protein [Streptomyces sp. MS1.HAVA.3]|uniref:PLP-dependent aminotransferase family protein n=1 Tax=Streptomyces caledonius TaxID=3134107 RepID=A0ABU8TXI0_9ACTN
MYGHNLAARPAPGSGPLYLRLSEGIARDIEAGRLPDGWRLPTVRAVAHRLGVTPGTVARAYAELRRRGLTSGEAGRGTFVRTSRDLAGFGAESADDAEVVDLSGNWAAPPPSALLKELGGVWTHGQLSTLLGTGLGRDADVLGADYLEAFGLGVPGHRVIATSGGQHALFTSLTALTRPGDRIAVDALANPGVRAAARLLNLRTVPVAHDEDGMRPDALAAVASDASVVVTTATLHNPTGVTLSAGRRAELAEVVRARRLTLVEDDPFGPLAEHAPPPVATLAPEHCVYLASTSKTLAPGLRLAFLSCPPPLADRMASAARGSAWTRPPSSWTSYTAGWWAAWWPGSSRAAVRSRRSASASYGNCSRRPGPARWAVRTPGWTSAGSGRERTWRRGRVPAGWPWPPRATSAARGPASASAWARPTHGPNSRAACTGWPNCSGPLTRCADGRR